VVVAAPGGGTPAALRGDGMSHGVAGGTVRVVLRSSDPMSLRERLGLPAAVEGSRLLLRVDADRSDALLLDALRWGASVESVDPG
jgi:hypothetical protein